MLPTESPRKYVFYHADRDASLKEDQEIKLDENQLSYFGRVYWPAFQVVPVDQMNPTQKREYYLEMIRNEPNYSLCSSRMQSVFAANTVAEAIVFATSILPKPSHPIPIIEILADRFLTLDSNWLDFADDSKRGDLYRNYWDGRITNHRPPLGERRPPRLEVIIPLPAMTGKIVHVVE